MKANDGYLICHNGCRLGRGYQPLWAFFCFTVLRSRSPERNDPQLIDRVTFVTWTESSGDCRLAIVSTRSNCGYGYLRGCETDRMKPGNHHGVPSG
jgi:hypothetical protein